ncbi:SDR family NAD(P)-dependent oxidoreductase [Streptacidiphilus sp. N1-10]|uniref:SDR family NAD(P)-dependent oxidoreductase n=1 Tax=Streptacidiphilus jeojiensis TaxID=3229225 RepID=A0ABV6XFG2_9ACTN
MSTLPTLTDRTILITGANRGIGRALLDEALQRGARRVYAASRTPFAHPDERVVPLLLDVTDAGQIQAAAERVDALDVLVNNAGLARSDDLTDRGVVEEHLAVNLFGPLTLTQAFRPALVRSGGAVVNVLSLASLASLPFIPAYSASKAAALSMTQSLRAMLAPEGVRVHAVLTGPVDTEMSRDLDVPKAAPAAVAAAILDGVAAGREEIFPDPMSGVLAAGWDGDAVKTLERANAPLIAAIAAMG